MKHMQIWSRWLRGVTACGLVSLWISAPMWGWGRTVSLVGPILVVVAMAATASRLTADRADVERRSGSGTRPVGSDELTWWCLVAVGCASVVLSMAVVAAASPALVLVWIGLLMATSPPARTAVLRCTRRAPGSGGGAPAEPDRRTLEARAASATTTTGRADVLHAAGCRKARIHEVDTTELCRLWRVTFWMVRDARSPVQAVVVVDLRQAVLDELERRCPDEVGRWLTSGRYGADGPARYL